MDELDILKKDWNRSDHGFKQVSEHEIYGMLHKKSSSIVKWILIISILEIILWTVPNFIGSSEVYFAGTDSSSLMLCLNWLGYLNYPVVLVFIFLFYRNFRRISATDSTHQLMANILRTRKTVNIYVWYNLAMIALMLVLSFAIAMIFSPEVRMMKQKMDEDTAVFASIVAILAFCTAFIMGIVWLVYRLVYGMLLKRLMVNYKELEKIDF